MSAWHTNTGTGVLKKGRDAIIWIGKGLPVGRNGLCTGIAMRWSLQQCKDTTAWNELVRGMWNEWLNPKFSQSAATLKTSSSCQPHPQNGKAYIQTELCRSVACCNVPGDPKESERNQSLKSESSSVVPLSGDGMGGGSGDGRGRCGWGPTRGMGGVAGVRRRGWEMWPDENNNEIISKRRRHPKTIRKSYQENGETPKP